MGGGHREEPRKQTEGRSKNRENPDRAEARGRVSRSGRGRQCPLFLKVKDDKTHKMSNGFTRRKLPGPWAKVVSEKRLERKARCHGGVDVKGRNRDRAGACCACDGGGGGGVGHPVKGRSFT